MPDLVEERYTLTVLRDGETGLPRAMTIRLGDKYGKLHSPPDGRPAFVSFDEHGRVEEMGWYENDSYHRIGAPALMKINPNNGVVFYEEYRNHGLIHRSYSEPAWTERDPKSGEIEGEYYFVNDEQVEPRLPPKLDLTP